MSSSVHRLIKQFQSYSEPSPNEDVGHREIASAKELQCNRDTPEISIVLAKDRQGSPEIDIHTGLPKLPVELPPPSSPSLERKVLPSVLKMSSGHSPTYERKSVTFDPTLEGEMDRPRGGKAKDDESAKVNKPRDMSKSKSDTSVVMRTNKRSNGRPTSLPNRSRSVFIRLQPPRGTPTTTHKRFIHSDIISPETEPIPEPEVVRDTGLNILESGSHSDSPIFSRSNTSHFGRRSSFLYQHGDSQDQKEPGRFLGGDDYVTPFAQVLSTLHRVRAEYLVLMGLPEDTKTAYTRQAWAPVPPSVTKMASVSSDKTEAMSVLEELDWSLKMLETVNANQSMGNVTGDKIKRLLNRELSHLSEGSENGAQVAEWVTDITNSDPYDANKVLYANPTDAYESSLSVSLSHDNWIRHRKLHTPERRITMEAESVPKFGVEVSDKKNIESMNEYVYGKLYTWGVDVFHFNSVCGGSPLVSSAYILFKKWNFFTEMQISPHTFLNYMTTIQNGYHSVNPYHNALHATDVLLTTNSLIKAESLEGVFTQAEVMAALVAAAVHDVDHPGVTNLFLVAIRHELAIMYNDISVLENHHVATAFRALQKPKCNFLENLDQDCVQLFRRAVIDMVLSTDMAKHIQNVAEMKTLIETKKLTNDGLLSLGNYKENSAVLKCLIHCADLSNPTKDPELAATWSYRIMEENFKQGDREKELGIPMHAIGDRDDVSIPKCQMSFIDFIVYPLWETWAELVYPDAQHVLDNIAATKSYWCKLAEEQQEEENKTTSDLIDPSSPGPSPEWDPSSFTIGVPSASPDEIDSDGSTETELMASADSATIRAKFEKSHVEKRSSLKKSEAVQES